MTEVLKERLRSININGLLDKTRHKASKVTLRELCGIAAFCYGILIFSVAMAMNLDIGYKVIVNDKNYGIVSSKEEAKLILEESIEETSGSKRAVELKNAGFYLSVTKASAMVDAKAMKTEIVSDLEGLVAGYGIYVDGTAVVALESEEEAKALVEELLLSYKNENNEVSFISKVEVGPARIRDSLLMDRNGAATVITGSKNEPVVHTVKKGETFSEIAESYGVSATELMNNNSGIVPERLQIGQKLNVTAPVPLISVKSVEQVWVNEKVPYEVKEQPDASMYKGIRKVLTSGVQGEKRVLYDVTKVNNVVSEKVMLDESWVSYPKTEIVAVGTKIRPKEAPTGKFIRPYYGSITSRYGYRWGRNHNGIDYGGRTGDPVKAADGGTVTFAGWNNGGYGYMVIINHGNGRETYYAHLNSVGVKKGQKVAQGSVIGRLGNTGRSTGPHLHFEIRINGRPVNPSGYVG